MRLIIVILTSFVLSSCVDLKSYYFPYSNFSPFKVYKYECLSDSTMTQYWKMSYHSKTSTFITESFNYKLERIEYFEETVGVNGTELVEFSEVVDGKKQGSLPPTSKDVYNWNDKTSYDYSVKFYSGSELILFEKERVYLGRESKQIESGEYNCVKFEEFYTMTIEGTDEQYKYKQFTYYAKDMGMIKYERVLPNGEFVELELTQILNKFEWEKLKSSSN